MERCEDVETARSSSQELATSKNALELQYSMDTSNMIMINGSFIDTPRSPRCSSPLLAASPTSYSEFPDSPISRFRRENDTSPVDFADDDEKKMSDDEYEGTLDSILEREIQAARRRANSCCSAATMNEIAPSSERVQQLVDKALNNPSGRSYVKPVSKQACNSPAQGPFAYTSTSNNKKVAAVNNLLAHSSLSCSQPQSRSASVSDLDGLTKTSASDQETRFVRHSPNEGEFQTVFSSLLDEESTAIAGIKSESIKDDDLDNEQTGASDGKEKSHSIPLHMPPSDIPDDDHCTDHSDLDDMVGRSRSSDILESDNGEHVARKTAHFAANVRNSNNDYQRLERSYSTGTELSMTESDVGSIDGLPLKLQQRWLQGDSRRENIMQNLDGLPKGRPNGNLHHQIGSSSSDPSRANSTREKKARKTKKCEKNSSLLEGWFSNLFGTVSDIPEANEEDNEDNKNDRDTRPPTSTRWQDDDTFAILGCANIIHTQPPVMPTSLVRVACQNSPLTYTETIHATKIDPRMQSWVQNHFSTRGRPPKDGAYHLGKSRAVIVHEIVRGNWTWCTAWSPDGTMLAVATENHHLAIVDTSNSAVWRVRHDRKITGPPRNGTTHSIRSIAWGAKFIAIGGTGNAVSILAAHEPYPILHTILETGFVGSLSWKPNSSDLAIASRRGKVLVVRIGSLGDTATECKKAVESQVLHEISRKGWVNSVAFSPGGRNLAIGDASGHLLVYNYLDEHNSSVGLTLVKSFLLEDSVIAVEWSADGQWLYAGGEDFRVTVVETRYWEIIHRVKRDRWVQCISSSHSGSHVAVGGVSSEISLLDVKNGWDSVMGIELNGLVPLSASWHPKDQYLSLTGQNNSILVVETTNARHVKGHHLFSVSKILATEFSPDGRTVIVGNSSGIITFFTLTGSTFETAYELVVMSNDRLSIQWSLNGVYIVVGSQNGVVIIGNTAIDRHKVPPKSAGYSVRMVIRDVVDVNSVSIDFQSQYVAVSGNGTWILDAASDFSIVREWTSGAVYANAWSPDGRWLATVGQDKVLKIYDTSDARIDRWRVVFSVPCDDIGRAVAWGPLIVGGLLYLAYGGDANKVTIMEIRSLEGTWETVLRISRAAPIQALDWSTDGLLAAAISNGTVSIIDLAYLQFGVPVNEMDYTWQRQALTCFTEIRRNRGKNCMRTVRWIPSAPGSDSLLAIGGTDGEVEIVDLTEKSRCRGYAQDNDVKSNEGWHDDGNRPMKHLVHGKGCG